MSAPAMQLDFLGAMKKRTPRAKGSLQSTAAKHEKEIELLKPLVVELAREAGDDGIIVADLRIAAVKRGLLPATSRGKELSWLGAVMEAAGLTKTDRWRRSHIDESHGNMQRVWVLEEACS